MKTLKRLLAGSALAAAIAVPVLVPARAEAAPWHGGYVWHGAYGWHGGWGWHPGWRGVYVGVPPVVVGPPVVYAAPYWHFVPGHYAPNGIWIAPHWGY